eukprot:4551585-Prymnesium_polylepis.1
MPWPSGATTASHFLMIWCPSSARACAWAAHKVCQGDALMRGKNEGGTLSMSGVLPGASCSLLRWTQRGLHPLLVATDWWPAKRYRARVADNILTGKRRSPNSVFSSDTSMPPEYWISSSKAARSLPSACVWTMTAVLPALQPDKYCSQTVQSGKLLRVTKA